MSKLATILALFMTAVIATGPAMAQEDVPKIEKEGNLYVLRMEGLYEFNEVLELLKINFFDQGWMVRDVHDIDIAMRRHGKLVENKSLLVSNPDYVARAIDLDPKNALTLSVNVIVFRDLRGVSELDYRSEPGDIVIAFMDPVEFARFCGLGDAPHCGDMLKDLRTAIEKTAEFFVVEGKYVPPKVAQ